MGALVLLLLTFLAAAVPDLAPRFLGIDHYPPDLLTATAVYLALRGRGAGVVLWGCLLGAAKDATSLDPLGTHAFVLGTVVWFFARDRERGGGDPVVGVSRGIAVAAAVILAHVLYALRSWPVAGHGVPFSTLLGAFPTAFYTALFTGPLFALLDKTGVLDDVAGRPDALRA